MKFRDYWAILRAHRLSVIGLALLVATLMGVLSYRAVPQYRASSSIYFSLPAGASGTDLSQGSTFTQAQVLSYAELAVKPVVLERVIADLHLDTSAQELSSAITASASTDTVIVDIEAVSEDPHEAADLANATTKELRAVVRELAPRNAKGRPAVDAAVVQPATAPRFAFSPQKKRNVAIGLVAGLLLGMALAIARELLNTKPRDQEEVAELTSAPVLAQIGRDKRLARGAGKFGEFAGRTEEAFRRLRTNLRYVSTDRTIDVVTITSSLANEGKSTVAINFALACADAGDRVLLIDADLRKPTVAGFLGLEQEVGLTNILADRLRLRDLIQKTAGHQHLDVLAAGETPPNPTQLLDSAAMADLIEEARAEYDMVVIDSPPLVPVSDAAVLARRSSGAVVVTNLRKVHRDQLSDSVSSLERVGAEVVGVVVNGSPAQDAVEYYARPRASHRLRNRTRRWRRPPSARQSPSTRVVEGLDGARAS